MNEVTLRNRFNHDPRTLTLRMMEAVIHRASQTIVDVFCLWNDKTHTWESDAPTLLRLENGDVCILPMDNTHIALSFDTVDVSEFYRDPLKPEAILSWRPLHVCSYTKGRRVASFTFGTSERGVLTALEAHLNDGGHLTIGAQGCNFSKASRRARSGDAEQFVSIDKKPEKIDTSYKRIAPRNTTRKKEFSANYARRSTAVEQTPLMALSA